MVSTLAAFVVTLGAVSASPVSVETDGAQWQTNYTKALAATRKNDRPLLVVVDKPDEPKQALKAEQLDVAGKQGDLLESYELCHVDADTKHGKKVADAFKAKEFPFTAIIDKNGEFVLAKKTGQLSSNEWKSTLVKYQKGVKVTKTYSTFYRGSMDTSISVGNTGCKECQLRAMMRQN